MKPKLTSEITCPECGHKEVETMPEDSCQYFMSARTARCCSNLSMVIAVYFAHMAIRRVLQSN